MVTIREKRIMLDGLEFCYCETGATAAPPIVALHALGRDGHNWDAVAEQLADHHRFLALDQRGHGKSAHPAAYSFELMRDDLAHFVDALHLDRFTLLGHSMGGTVAYLFAEQQPERVARLILEDTPPPFGGNQKVPDKPTEPVPFDWRLLAPIIHQLNEPDPAWWERLNVISAPTLIIGGGSTSFIPQDRLAEVAQRIPTATFVTIEQAGHAVHANKLAEFVAVVQTFLTETTAH